ncbi:MAG TPA: DNA repair exonuclease [Acidobacteriota bacterium]|nr:DNA repair exonuclease [Acidobacteriota bacterium]
MKPLRFIHTSDIHLDTSFSGEGLPSRLGGRKREAIRGTFRRILEEARIHAVDIVLIAGDLYEADHVTPDTIEFLKQQFENLASTRVFIAPGNHDPFTKQSPYREESWPSNVHIFDAEEFRSADLPDLGARVTGFGFSRNFLDERYFRRLPILPDGPVNIVIAHGSDVTRVPLGKSEHGPFTVEEIARKNIQYCALGHYHRQHRLPNPVDDTQIWYSGIPEGRGWDEEGECAYLLGEIADGAVTVERRPCSRLDFATITVNCDAYTTREQILDAILRHKGTAFGPGTILRIRLSGDLDVRIDVAPAELEERLAGECLHIQWDDRTCPSIDFDAIAAEKTISGRFVRILNERIAAASEKERIILERARLYGIQALGGREVRLR